MERNKPTENQKPRLANYELLRICAIIMISLMHGIKDAYGSLEPLNAVAHVAVNAIGNTGVTLFVLISGFFGLRLRPSKLFWLWSTIFFYSLLIFFVQYGLQEIPNIGQGETKALLKHLFTACTPITSKTWWFCTSYFIVFLLSPLFNKASQSMSKRQFQYLLAVMLVLFSLSPTFLIHSVSGAVDGKCTENMILAYFLGRYIAIYGMPHVIRAHAGKLLVGCLTIIFIVNYFLFDPLFLSKDHSFFIILAALCIFYFFGQLNIASDRANSMIRYAASYAFPYYLLNVFLIDLLDFQLAGLANSLLFLPNFLLVQLEILGITIVIDLVRRLLTDKMVKKIADKLDSSKLSRIIAEI